MTATQGSPLLVQYVTGSGEDGDPFRLVAEVPHVARRDQLEAAAAEAGAFIAFAAAEAGAEPKYEELEGSLGRLLKTSWTILPACEHLAASGGAQLSFIHLSRRTAAWCAPCAELELPKATRRRGHHCDLCGKYVSERRGGLHGFTMQLGQMILTGAVCRPCMTEDGAA